MKLFEMLDLRAAYEHAQQGGQSLHLHTLNAGHPLFRRFPVVAHLIDYNRERLIQTARSLGVRVIKIGREGQKGQHIDLCGSPLDRARALCAQPSLFPE